MTKLLLLPGILFHSISQQIFMEPLVCARQHIFYVVAHGQREDEQAAHGETDRDAVGRKWFKRAEKKGFLVLFLVFFPRCGNLSATRSVRKDGQGIWCIQVQWKDNTWDTSMQAKIPLCIASDKT